MQHSFSSRALEGNPWGDPVERTLPIYLPPSGETEGKPLLVYLAGYTGTGLSHFLPPRFLEDSLVGRLDRLIRARTVAEAVLVAPNCLTTLGGSQYLNSSATGRYDEYVTREIVPWIQEKYRTGPVAVVGTSSGGFGALSLALRHPEVYEAAASDSGDMYFEYGYLPGFPSAFRAIRKAGGPEALLRRVFRKPIDGFGPRHPMANALEFCAYASCYSPIDSEPGRFELPFDTQTGSLRPEIWRRWLKFDPVRMIQTPRYRRALRRLRYIYVDGGSSDEWTLDVCARIFASIAREQGARVDHLEFSGGHFDVGPRYEAIFPRVLRALTGNRERRH
ncbi:MAG: alpha/beta hydrolase-fold protein [Thermoplasmata archaeon]